VRNFKVLLTSSRSWHDLKRIESTIVEIHHRVRASDDWLKKFNGFELMHGDCPTGGDRPAGGIAKAMGWLVNPEPADWDHCAPNCPRPVGHRRVKRINDILHPGLLEDYCPKAGSRRNKKMVAQGHDLCIACFLGFSYGTTNCVKYAEQAGIKVVRYLDN
jgi:hypothetical protein